MKRLCGLISYYLTVAVLVSVALMPFAVNSSEIKIIENEITAEPSVFGEYDSTVAETVVEEDCTQEESSFITADEETAEEEKSYVSDNVTVTSQNSGEDTVASESCEGAEESSEYVIETEPASENQENVSEEEEELQVIEDIKPSLYESYAPALSENVYDLYFLASNIGYLSTEDSVNVYTFTLENRAMFSFSVTHAEILGLAGWNVSLYGEYYINGDNNEKGYRLITSLVTTPSAAKESSPEIGLGAGNYRLVVTKGNGYTSEKYQIDARYKDTSGYEIECNDNIYRYTEIYSFVPVRGSASYFSDRQDEDYYMFRMYEDGFAELKFSHPAVKDKTSVCWQVIFFSEDGTELYSVNSLFTDENNTGSAIGLKKGNYFVLVRNRVYTDITYTLSISRTSDRSYEKEKNDTMASANAISLNTTVIGSVSSQTSTLDKDWFSFNIEKTGCVMIELAHKPFDDDKDGWNYELYDSKGEILFSGISKWTDDVVSSPEIGLGGGTYYIKIDSEDLYHNDSEYYLSVNFNESDDWESEYNNTFGRADMLQSSIPVYGFLAECGIDYDFDYFTFTLNDTADISVIFSHEALSYSRNIFTFTLYDESQTAVADSNGNTNIKVYADKESTEAVYKQLSPGKYYIKVGTGQFFDLIKYSLSFK